MLHSALQSRWLLTALCALLLHGCSESDPIHEESSRDTAIQQELDTRIEVMHQTREVLQYTIEQQALEQERLKALDTGPAK
jgi:hypothetical protein